MTEPINFNQKNKDEDFFDVDALPDLDESTETNVAMTEQKREEEKMVKKELIKLPKDDPGFMEAIFTQKGTDKVRLKFRVGQDDLKRITSMSYGLISTDISEGVYEFDIKVNEQGLKELYYYGEFAGEYVGGEPRIYKRYFAIAVVRSLLAQEILYEYETNKFTIHPLFFKKIMASNKAVAEQLKKTGFKTLGDEEFAKLQEKQKADQEAKDNKK